MRNLWHLSLRALGIFILAQYLGTPIMQFVMKHPPQIIPDFAYLLILVWLGFEAMIAQRSVTINTTVAIKDGMTDADIRELDRKLPSKIKEAVDRAGSHTNG